MTASTAAYALPSRRDGTENTNPYAFIEDIVRAWLRNPVYMSTSETLVQTYQEITAGFLIISRHVSEILGYFKTLAFSDPFASPYQHKVMHLEIIFGSTHDMMMMFHSKAMLFITGSKKDITVSQGFCFSVLSAMQALSHTVTVLMQDKRDLETSGAIKSKEQVGAFPHPACQHFDVNGFTVFH